MCSSLSSGGCLRVGVGVFTHSAVTASGEKFEIRLRWVHVCYITLAFPHH